MNGTFKGTVGELMFKMSDKNIICSRFFSYKKFSYYFYRYFTEEQNKFIKDNWYSFDALKVRNKELILYEVKTKNIYRKGELSYRPKMTKSTVNMYTSAKKLGFKVMLAFVKLKTDWQYEIELKEFSEENYCIDKAKKYDKR
ncbi:MAG: hypothetical protein ACLFTH_04020 [Candidatus Woesearchaeota archaeon]